MKKISMFCFGFLFYPYLLHGIDPLLQRERPPREPEVHILEGLPPASRVDVPLPEPFLKEPAEQRPSRSRFSPHEPVSLPPKGSHAMSASPETPPSYFSVMTKGGSDSASVFSVMTSRSSYPASKAKRNLP